jgi:hypothetical protein
MPRVLRAAVAAAALAVVAAAASAAAPVHAAAAASAAAAGAPASSPGFLTYDSLGSAPYAVSYDNRSFSINGQRTLFLSGVLHYPRSTPLMWDDLMTKARNNGLNMIQTYTFWNAHQHKPGEWDFAGPLGSYNVTGFLDAAARAGLFVTFRVGPYVCAEWNYGGFPVWLNEAANLTTRASDPAWEALSGAYFEAIVGSVRDYFADRGGPIVMAQVENELHTDVSRGVGGGVGVFRV